MKEDCLRLIMLFRFDAAKSMNESGEAKVHGSLSLARERDASRRTIDLLLERPRLDLHYGISGVARRPEAVTKSIVKK